MVEQKGFVTMPNPIEHIKEYIWLGVPYFIGVGLLYLYAYWFSFDVNILEYASLSDVVKVSILPIGSSFFLFIIGVVLGIGYISIKPETLSDEKKLPLTWIVTRPGWILWLLYGSFFILIQFAPHQVKWMCVGSWVPIAPFFILMKSNFLAEIGDLRLRLFMIMFLTYLPFYAFSNGKINSDKILYNTEFLYTKGTTPDENMKYIGYINQLVFLISKDNQHIKIERIDKDGLDLFRYSDTKIEAKNKNKPTLSLP